MTSHLLRKAEMAWGWSERSTISNFDLWSNRSSLVNNPASSNLCKENGKESSGDTPTSSGENVFYKAVYFCIE